jgi:hypothetical protein
MTSHLTISSVGGTSPFGLVGVSKTSGVLTAIGVAGGPGYHYFQVTIDGTVLGRDYLSGILSGPAHGNNGLGVGLPFEQSLDVSICNAKSFPQALFWVAYVTNGSEIVGEERDIRTVDGIDYEYVQRRYQAGPDTEPYVVESLVGARRWSRVILREDVLLPGDDLIGTLRLVSEGDPEPPPVTQMDLVLQLPGTTRPLLRREVERLPDDVFIWSSDSLESGLSEILRVPPFARPRPFALQVVADIPGFVNYPSVFSLL